MTAQRIASLPREGTQTAAESRWPLGTNSIVAVFATHAEALGARAAVLASGGRAGYIVEHDELTTSRDSGGAIARFFRADPQLDDALEAHTRAGETLLAVPEVEHMNATIEALRGLSARLLYRRGRWITERMVVPALTSTTATR